MIGKTSEKFLQEGVQMYADRLRHYLKFSIVPFPNLKKVQKLSPEQFRIKEGALLLKSLKSKDHVILLDEKGKRFTSVNFSAYLEQQLYTPNKRIIFIIGGAYGVSAAIKNRADLVLSLSDMTLSHQLIRLFFVEQLYRAMTILKNQPYHNEG